MQQDSSTVPHVWLLVSNGITAFVTFVTTLAALWFKRKREPAEVRKIDAETRNIHTTSDVSFGGLTLETFREIQAVIRKAEQRREEWLLREEQMRTQIIFWRNKAEELDGQLIDSREANGQLQTRLKMKKDDLDKAMGLLKIKHISFSETDQPKQE